MRFGLLLPHFSKECKWERLIGFAPRIEELGFDSVWVRDHLSYVRHGYELEGDTFIDPFITLSAIAGATTRLTLGTAVLVPFRHPVLTAQMVGSLAWASRGRVEIGIGPGARTKPFELAGVPYPERIGLTRDTARVLRLLSTESNARYQGDVTSFEGVTVQPGPPTDLFIWYGGASRASVRRAADYCDGLLPGLCTFAELEKLRERADEASPDRKLAIGTIPFVSVAETMEKAEEKLAFAVPHLLAYLSDKNKTSYSSVHDLGGAVILGTPDQCAEQIAALESRGLDTLVLDLRLVMGEFEEAVETLAAEVLHFNAIAAG
jgi:alkanesulfonate monooxygenase SsuD/methylene tetrahydromethanopterin reductase-like flavin-dependent oxidoreductase (luciferase family)